MGRDTDDVSVNQNKCCYLILKLSWFCHLNVLASTSILLHVEFSRVFLNEVCYHVNMKVFHVDANCIKHL